MLNKNIFNSMANGISSSVGEAKQSNWAFIDSFTHRIEMFNCSLFATSEASSPIIAYHDGEEMYVA